MECDFLVVGAGIFGSTIAERLANGLDAQVVVIDKRGHIGGNCYSETDHQTGIEFHRYGTHIFHTSSKKVWEYLGKFAEFNGYHHQVLAVHGGKVYQMPINLETINSFYNLNLKPWEARKFLSEEIKKENIKFPANLEEKAISVLGRPLYEAFIKSYTKKHWGRDPKELPAEIFNRLPLRFDYKEDYFLDSRWQGLALDGYTKMFERMLDNPKINVILNCDYLSFKDKIKVKKKTIYTGPLDGYFDHKLGRLQWRSIQLKKEVVLTGDYQGTAVMNYTDADVDFTRIHEPRHLHVERGYSTDKTVIFHEYAGENDQEPYYPVNNPENNALAQKYRELLTDKDVIIGGRLGDYAYYDMDKTVLKALECYETRILNVKAQG